MGIEDNHGMAWLAVAESTDFDMPAAKSRKRKQEREPSRLAGPVARLRPTEALRVRGTPNPLNALAALALVGQFGLGGAAGKGVVWGKGVSVRVGPGGRRTMKKKKQTKY